ncbi:MAG: ATP-binding cassette domain-containing protein [Bacteroidetes bacterium]|nr:ATP-binding cassette domain-containing protein [Bacteroidota bacterium]
MDNYTIETKSLCKSYGKEQVLQNVNLEVPEKSVYGFLGKNGAGKTTTLKIITGLIRSDSGSCHVFGKSIKTDREFILKNTGAIIESPGFYANLTAKENLALFQSYYGTADKKRVEECLEIVELHSENKPFEKFSLGMKQRLGIAFALLNKPKLLILDEPTNGLDPEGIIKIRELIKKFSQELNITILISSHILPEVQQIATHIGIIDKGSLIKQGTVEELFSSEKREYTISVSDIKNLSSINGFDVKISKERNEVKLRCSKDEASRYIKKILDNGIEVYSMTYNNSLEELFFNLTSEK